jgi:hypothetical protein
MITETHETFEVLKGAKKVPYDLVVEKQVQLVELLASRGDNSKAHKEVLQAENIKLKEMCEQASEWAMAAYPEEFMSQGSSKPSIFNRNREMIFEDFEFMVLIRKKT